MKEIYGVILSAQVEQDEYCGEVSYLISIIDQNGKCWHVETCSTNLTNQQIKAALNKAADIVQESVREYLAG